MYLEILLTIWFVLWLFTKIGFFPDYIKNSWDTADIKLILESISKQIDRLIVQVTLTEVEKKGHAQARVEEFEQFRKEEERKRKQKIQTICANKASKAESDVGASLVYSACLKENNYY